MKSAALKLILGACLALGSINTVVADDSSVVCLAKVIYYEARGEPERGKLAVAQVALNRVASNKFPNDMCSVVYQKFQFEWTSKPHKIKNKAAWAESLALAKITLAAGITELGHFPATHFHSTAINPNWKLKRVTKIGNHIFYK